FPAPPKLLREGRRKAIRLQGNHGIEISSCIIPDDNRNEAPIMGNHHFTAIRHCSHSRSVLLQSPYRDRFCDHAKSSPTLSRALRITGSNRDQPSQAYRGSARLLPPTL